jgi:hypothetical protein
MDSSVVAGLGVQSLTHRCGAVGTLAARRVTLIVAVSDQAVLSF